MRRTCIWWAVMLTGLSFFPACGFRRVPAPDRLIVVVMDALRRDHVSAYGYPKPTTPGLEALAAEGIRFEDAVSASSWTQPAIASLFTSTYPSVHHVTRTPGSDASLSVLPPELTTLAEFLRDQGFITHAVCSHPYLGEAAGFDQGFMSFDRLSSLLDERESEKIMDRALAWIKTQPKTCRFFLYLHLMGPHFPYIPPAEFAERFTTQRVEEVKALFAGKSYEEQNEFMSGEGRRLFADRPELLAELVGLYDAEAAFADAQVQRLFSALQEEGRLSGTMLIILSDHGEGFLEHGAFGHGNSLFAELVRVPLIIYYPPLGRGKSVTRLVSLLDVFPTLVALFSAPRPAAMQGESFLPLLAGKERKQPVLSELHVMALARLTTEKYALIFRPTSTRQQGDRTTFHNQTILLFDRAADPGETQNLAASRPEIAEDLLHSLLAIEEENRGLKVPAAKQRKLSEEQVRALKALGYLRESRP